VVAPNQDTELVARYRAYLSCLNERRWDDLADHVAHEVVYNGEAIGLAGYRARLESDVLEIPDLRFGLALLVVQQPWLAA